MSESLPSGAHAHAPIAIVGMSCRFGGAQNVQDYWNLIVEGRNGFSRPPANRWDHDAFFDANPRKVDKQYAPVGGFIDDIHTFPALALQIPPRRVEVMDPQQRMSLECSLEAVADSGRTAAELPHRTGVFMGVTATEWRTLSAARTLAQMMATGDLGTAPQDVDILAAAVSRAVPPRPLTAAGVLANMIAATVAQELGLHGPAYTTDAACASAMIALYDAINGLRAGAIDAALAGGVYLTITPEQYVAFSRIGAMSKQGLCLPFDERADGFVQGDGCGIVLLKRLDDAIADGDRIYSVLRGIGINNDGGGAGPMAPIKEGQIEVITQAWDNAQTDPVNLGYVEAHGTGTHVGDKIEFDGLNATLGDRVKSAGLGSSKANVGHTMSAAGIAGVIRATLALYHETIPPMSGFESAKPDLGLRDSPFDVPTSPREWTGDGRLACVSSFGFGGTNVHAVLESHTALSAQPALAASPATEPQAELILISAGDIEGIRATAARTATAIERDSRLSVAGVAHAWRVRSDQPCRLAVVAATREELCDRLAAVGRGESVPGTTIGTADGDPPNVAFLYPGQGAQRIGMIAGIRDRFPIVAETLKAMDRALEGVHPISASELLYPELRTAPIDEAVALAQLTDTENCQPALYAVGAALTRLLESVGVTPMVTAGHSVGEFTAAAAAGLYSYEEGQRWTARRGQGMGAMTGDRGAMAAIVADQATVESLLEDGVVIANVNHPRQFVVSGDSAAVQRVADKATAKEIKAVVLRVSHGFHSPVFDTLNLDDAVDAIEMGEATIPVVSGIIDGTYTDASVARGVFKSHAQSPVIFTRALENCAAAGADLFLQVGAGGPLIAFARGTLKGENKGILSVASKDDADGGRSLLLALGELYVRGVSVDVRSITASALVASVPPLQYARTYHWCVRESAGRIAFATGSVDRVVATADVVSSSTANDAANDVAASNGVADLVIAAVARASAYPKDALRTSMGLIADLGFDSMMVADLAEELTKTIPGVQGIPQELLINQPTIQDLIDFAESSANDGPAEEIDDNAPLARYAPVWGPVPLSTIPAPATPGAALSPYAIVGPGADALCAQVPVFAARAVAVESADTVIYVAQVGEPIPVRAVLANEHAAPDPAGDFIATIDAIAKSGREANVVVLRRDDDVWADALTGAVRCIAQEWPTRRVKSVRFAAADGLAAMPARIAAELTGDDLTIDVRYASGVRTIAGSKRLAEHVSPWSPTKDDVVAISGGTRGIGLALAERIADLGAHVLIIGRSSINGLAHKLVANTERRIDFVQADVCDADALGKALAAHPPITAAIHAAGVLADGPLGEVDASAGALARSVKVVGFLNLVRASGSSLKRVLGIGSWAGRFGNRHQTHYGAANALLASVADAIGAIGDSVEASVSEFGPWTESAMVQTIPSAIQATMRAEGVDFVGDEAGHSALLEDLGAGDGAVIRGRRVPSTSVLIDAQMVVASDTHPFLLDHAIDGHPVWPLAAATDRIACAAGLSAPFEVRNLTLYQGIVVDEPQHVHARIRGEKAEIRSGESGKTLCYRAEVGGVTAAFDVPEQLTGGDAPSLPLSEFYGGLTFHGPLLQGITRIDAVGANFIRGAVRTGTPDEWINETSRASWTVDPLAFDSAMQLAAYVAWTRFRRAGTPVGFERYVQLQPMPAGELTVEVRFGDAVDDKFVADIVFRDASGAAVAIVEKVTAQLREVDEATEPAHEGIDGFVPAAEFVNPAEWPGYKDLKMRMQMVEAMGMKIPYFDLHEGTARDTTIIDGKEIIHFSGYNYLGLSGDERVRDAVKEAIDKYGTSVSASRIAGGERPFHRELEAELAAGNGAEDAIAMPAGHSTNVTTIGHLFGPKDLILHDELIHDSCLQGIKLSGAARRSFRHEDLAHLEAQLKELRPHYEKCLILIEGVYSMDGDIANVPEFIKLKKQFGCMLMIDEAHSFGTIGATGFGCREYFDIDGRDVDIWMGTMSKSLASMGGWIAGSKELIEYLRYTTPGFVFAAGMAPALGAAALASIKLWRTTDTWRVEKLQHNCKYFFNLLKERGIDTGPTKGQSPVLPVVTGDSMQALMLSERLLLRDQINAKPIIFPAVANDSARLRFFINAPHSEAQLLKTADAIERNLREIRAELAAQ